MKRYKTFKMEYCKTGVNYWLIDLKSVMYENPKPVIKKIGLPNMHKFIDQVDNLVSRAFLKDSGYEFTQGSKFAYMKEESLTVLLRLGNNGKFRCIDGFGQLHDFTGVELHKLSQDVTVTNARTHIYRKGGNKKRVCVSGIRHNILVVSSGDRPNTKPVDEVALRLERWAYKMQLLNMGEFEFDYDLKILKHGHTEETELILPSGIQFIEELELVKMRKLVLPDTLQELDLSDIRVLDDGELQELVIPDLVERVIGDLENARLRKLTIGAGVRNLKLLDMMDLEYVEVSPSSKHFTSVDGIVYTKDMKTLLFCPVRKTGEVEIPEGVELIMPGAFDGRKTITGINLPSTLKIISERCFCGCSGLKELVVPDSVEKIGSMAFACNDSIRVISIGRGAWAIMDDIVKGCSNLERVVIWSKPYIIGKQDRDPGTRIEFKGKKFPENVDPLAVIAEIRKTKGKLERVTIPDGVEAVEDELLLGAKYLKSVRLPDSVYRIGVRAFYRCTELRLVKYGASLRRIEAEAFLGCREQLRVVERGTGESIRDTQVEIGRFALVG